MCANGESMEDQMDRKEKTVSSSRRVRMDSIAVILDIDMLII